MADWPVGRIHPEILRKILPDRQATERKGNVEFRPVGKPDATACSGRLTGAGKMLIDNGYLHPASREHIGACKANDTRADDENI